MTEHSCVALVWQIADYLELLPEFGLVQWSSGNISARCDDHVIIKPSGIPYHSEFLVRFPTVIVSMDGDVIGGNVDLKPSVDTPIHLGIYQRRPDVRAIVHTHSTYATAFAAAGKPIPPVVTMAADVFGGPIPCCAAFLTEPDDIAAVVAVATTHKPAMLLRGHGVFTVGESVAGAVKAAVLVEEVAKVAFLSRQLGWNRPLPADIVVELHERYQGSYGQ